ncbi:hypothetical protein O3M35_008015 [Rhynocoris fuscipes]|uniref:Single domain-containing protein n=1 Tax=Rhynocoris fuscipes TaxID=488301 RepID=A0AAW1D5J1_9HEMI
MILTIFIISLNVIFIVPNSGASLTAKELEFVQRKPDKQTYCFSKSLPFPIQIGQIHWVKDQCVLFKCVNSPKQNTNLLEKNFCKEEVAPECKRKGDWPDCCKMENLECPSDQDDKGDTTDPKITDPVNTQKPDEMNSDSNVNQPVGIMSVGWPIMPPWMKTTSTTTQNP